MKRFAGLAVAIAALVFAAPPVAAQGADGGAIQFRFGGFFPSRNSAFWDASKFYFTLDESDFNDIILGGSWLTPLNNHLEIGFNIDFYDATVLAADAQFEDETGNPILHDTSLSMIPMTVDLRIYPAGRNAVRGSGGRIQVRRPSFYVGGGAGMNLWEYEEVGDFVAGDLTIYFDQLKDDSAAWQSGG